MQNPTRTPARLVRSAFTLAAVLLLACAAPAVAQHDDPGPAAEDTTHGEGAGSPTYVPEKYDKHGEAYPDDPSGHDPATPGQGHHPEDQHGDSGHDDAHAAAAHAEGDHHGEHGEGHDDHGAHGSMPHLPSILTFIKGWGILPEAGNEFLDEHKDPIFSMTMALFLSFVFVGLSRKLDAREPGRLQMAVEMLFGGLYSLFRTILGSEARTYTPYLGSLFIFILCNNLFGLLPLGHGATSSFANTTFALGLMTFFYVQAIALKKNGIGGYLHHMAGSPKTALDWGLVVLFFPLHLIGELIKPLSLSLRLFGNIFGEETLVATMVLLGAGITYSLTDGFAFAPGLPLQFPFYFLGLLSSTIQALVFTLLSTVYIALWMPHGHDEAHGH